MEKQSRKEEEKDREEARASKQACKRKRKKKEKENSERARKLTGFSTQSARAVQACGMEETDSNSQHRHGKKTQNNTESTVGRSAGLLTGPKNQVGSKAC